MQAQAVQDFAFAVREFGACARGHMGQPLDNGVKQVLTYCEAGDLSKGFGWLLCDCAGPPQQRLDAHDEFLHPEGLLQVVVGPHLKAMHHIVDRRPCREEDDRRLLVGLADAAHEFIAVKFGHHHIGNEDIRPLGGIQLQCLLAITRHRHVKSLTVQGVLDDHRQGAFILGQQYVDGLAHFNPIVKVVPSPLLLTTRMDQPCFSTIVLT